MLNQQGPPLRVNEWTITAERIEKGKNFVKPEGANHPHFCLFMRGVDGRGADGDE